jgi:DNA helicase II / ATP-dependent DNA helicase PcrA
VYDYLSELNAVQQEAVKCVDGPSLVIAGAGSGKTRVLTFRIAHLLSLNVKAYKIMALTFTNKAAKEMKERIGTIIGHETTRMLWMGTFHSIFSRILRVEADKLGFTPTFTIYDTQDSKSLVKTILKELKLDEEIYKLNEVFSRISSAKNNLITAQAYATNPQIYERDASSRKPQISDVYKIYTMRCKKANAMDFDDLLLYTNILFRDFPDVLAKYQQQFSHILVDEYQDTNFAQYLIINKLSALHRNVCVVGDDAQSIYSFRGAKIENILNFRNDYPEYRLFKLEQNYRSTQTIVDAANSLIAKNKNQIQKKVFSENEKGEKIKILHTQNDMEEGFLVSNNILDTRLQNHLAFSDFAILYRTNAQSRIFEESLRKRNIPYKLYGALSFYQRKEIKDTLAYFRLAINEKDEEALKRVINYPARGIGDTTMGKLESISNAMNVSIWETISQVGRLNTDLNKGTISKLHAFYGIINGFREKITNTPAYDLALHIATVSGILKDLHNENTPESLSKFQNVEELLNAIREFASAAPAEAGLITLDKYLENVSLLTDADTEKPEDKDKVSLMTIHSAKGLEFKNIYIVGVEEDLFPSRFTATSEQDIEEERRLFYVALTRAKDKATISYTETRFKWGSPTFCKPSRFIREIDESFLEMPDEGKKEQYAPVDNDFESQRTRYFKPKAEPKPQPERVSPLIPAKNMVKMRDATIKTTTQTEFQADDTSGISVGMKVQHERFGLGTVMNLDGTLPNMKATVNFEKSGEKQLLLKFAKLKILGSN